MENNLTESEVPLNDFEIIPDFECQQQNHEVRKVQETGASEFNAQEDINCGKACTTADIPKLISEEYSINRNLETETNIDQNNIEGDKENKMEDESVLESNNPITMSIITNSDYDINPTKNDILQENNIHTQNQLQTNITKKITVLSNVVVKSRNLSPVFSQHLKLPYVPKTAKRRLSMNRIGAISSDEWRQFERKRRDKGTEKEGYID